MGLFKNKLLLLCAFSTCISLLTIGCKKSDGGGGGSPAPQTAPVAPTISVDKTADGLWVLSAMTEAGANVTPLPYNEEIQLDSTKTIYQGCRAPAGTSPTGWSGAQTSLTNLFNSSTGKSSLVSVNFVEASANSGKKLVVVFQLSVRPQ